MKKVNLLVLLFMYGTVVPAQEKNTLEALDQFFAGVPLKEDFGQWFYYIRDNPFLGIDSMGKKGYYSSFKPGIKSSFPFPDSMPVKLLVKRTVFNDSLTGKSFDSTTIILIEVVFTGDKAGRKKSKEVFRDLRKKLGRHYNQQITYQNTTAYLFKQGKGNNFPECSLWQGYEDGKKFYYVMIAYEFPVRENDPWYLQLAS